MEKFFDYKVSEFLQVSITEEVLTMHGPRRWGIPKSITEISTATGLSKRRVIGCLGRLKKNNKVVPDGERWKIVV